MFEEIEDLLNGVTIPPERQRKYFAGWLVLLLFMFLPVMNTDSSTADWHGPIYMGSDLQIGRTTWFGLFAKNQAAADACEQLRRIARELRRYELHQPGAVPRRVFELSEQFCRDSGNGWLVRLWGRYGADPWGDEWVVDGVRGVVRCRFDGLLTGWRKRGYVDELTVGFRARFRFRKARLVGRDRVDLYLSKGVRRECAEGIEVAVHGRRGLRPKVEGAVVVGMGRGCRIELTLAEELDEDVVGFVIVKSEVVSVDGEVIPAEVLMALE